MDGCSPEDAALLEPLLFPERVQRMEDVLGRRTRNLVLVAEDLLDPHNMAALLRSCDAFGVQDVHTVAGDAAQGRFNPSHKVAGGAARWLTLHAWADPAPCIANLKSRGVQLAVTSLTDAVPMGEVDFTQPTAIVMGNEKRGVSDAWMEAADVRFRIPMFGFVESLNISVAAALILQHASTARKARYGAAAGDLTEAERIALRSQWIYEDVREAPAVLAEIKRRHEAQQA